MKPVAFILFAGLIAGLPAVGSPQSATTRPTQSDPPRRAMSSQQALGQRLSEFKVEGIPFIDVMSMLSEASGANFYIRWNQLEQVGVDRQTPVSVQLRNTTLAKTLDVILDSVEVGDISLGYYVHENVITVSISRSQRTDLLTRVYDITDLMYQIPDIQPGDYGGTGGGGGGGYGSNNNSGSSGGGGSRSSSNSGSRMGRN